MPLRDFESANHIVRGAPGSEALGHDLWGILPPNPGGRPFAPGSSAVVSLGDAFFVEALGTAVLVLVVLCVTDTRNSSRPGILTPLTIGATITLLICLLAPFTMAGFNPARDFGPRLFSAVAGWGRLAFSANGSGWLVAYILGPLSGGQAGALIYRLFFRTHYLASAPT